MKEKKNRKHIERGPFYILPEQLAFPFSFSFFSFGFLLHEKLERVKVSRGGHFNPRKQSYLRLNFFLLKANQQPTYRHFLVQELHPFDGGKSRRLPTHRKKKNSRQTNTNNFFFFSIQFIEWWLSKGYQNLCSIFLLFFRIWFFNNCNDTIIANPFKWMNLIQKNYKNISLVNTINDFFSLLRILKLEKLKIKIKSLCF